MRAHLTSGARCLDSEKGIYRINTRHGGRPMLIAGQHTDTRQDVHIRLSSQLKSPLAVLAKERECSLT
jgi:hypothetical protein